MSAVPAPPTGPPPTLPAPTLSVPPTELPPTLSTPAPGRPPRPGLPLGKWQGACSCSIAGRWRTGRRGR